MHNAILFRRWMLGVSLGFALAISIISQSLSIRLVEVWASGSLILTLLALAAAIVISCGRIDISSGAAMSTVGMIIVSIAGLSGMSKAGFAIGHLAGAGYLTLLYTLYFGATRVGVPSIIVTLSGLLISKGFSTIIQACMLGVGQICRRSEGPYPSTLMVLPGFSIVVNNLALSIVLGVLIVGGLAWWRYRSPSGLQHVATGMDETAAEFARISTDHVRGLAFAIAAMLIFAATLLRLYGENNGGWTPNTGWGDELIAIAVAVIGGARVTGGQLDPVNVGLAALVVYIWRDVIVNDLGMPTEATSLLFGVLLIAMSWTDMRRKPRH